MHEVTKKSKPRRNMAAEKILAHARATLFPVPERPDPTEFGAWLRGYADALEAVGYDLGQKKEET